MINFIMPNPKPHTYSYKFNEIVLTLKAGETSLINNKALLKHIYKYIQKKPDQHKIDRVFIYFFM